MQLAELTAERSGFKSPARRGKRARTEVYGDGDSEDIGDSGGENALDSPSGQLSLLRTEWPPYSENVINTVQPKDSTVGKVSWGCLVESLPQGNRPALHSVIY